MKQYITVLRNLVPWYVPVKNDKVDQALATYIHKSKQASHLKLLFLRISPQTYYIGGLKAKINLYNNILQIQLGEELINIDTFLKKY